MTSVFRRKKQENLFDSGPEAFNLLMKEAVVGEFLDEQEQRAPPPTLQHQHQQRLKEESSLVARFKTWIMGTKVHQRLGQTFNIYSNTTFGYI
jgi:hypothetical protein